ncbi:MAG: hypothetical protein L6V84_03910 [Oscillospiraceae bacterium]|nr:MAG: hypothetical protein L6V84_03910 [Oscillospiraceae bacterium]
MKKIRIISLLMAVLMILPFAAACKTTEGDGTGTGTGTSTATGSNKPAKDDGTLNYINVDGLTYGKDGDYISLYDLYGKEVTIADVKQNDDGDYYIEKDGKQYVLGLDFLSMAMVYNCGSGSETEQKQAFAKWWQYYIERWNKLVPEMPPVLQRVLRCVQHRDRRRQGSSDQPLLDRCKRTDRLDVQQDREGYHHR